MMQLVDPQYTGRPERATVFRVEARDANCPQQIPPRYTEDEIATSVQSLRDRLRFLEAENYALREAVADLPRTSGGDR